MFMDWCIDMLVGVLNRHVAWRLLMHWRVGCVLNRRVGWRLLTDAWTCWLACWIDMLVDVYWCTDVLVGMLNQHVGWHLLMYWCVGWYVESTCWLTFTDALTYCLVCWIDTMDDSNCFNQCNYCRPIVAIGYKKTQEKETICLLYIQSWFKTFILL